MKLVAKIAAVLAALALAAPALACEGQMEKTAETKPAPSQAVAKADRQKKPAAPAKRATEKRPAATPAAAN